MRYNNNNHTILNMFTDENVWNLLKIYIFKCTYLRISNSNSNSNNKC